MSPFLTQLDTAGVEGGPQPKTEIKTCYIIKPNLTHLDSLSEKRIGYIRCVTLLDTPGTYV